MVSRFEKGKHGMRRFVRSLALILTWILCVSLFSTPSLAENDEFRARDGNGWSLTADGVLTIENNSGWQDYLKNGACEVINELIIGKELTEFSLFDDSTNGFVGSDIECPRFQPKQIKVEDGNPIFIMKNGLLIETTKNAVISSELSVRDVIIPDGIQKIGAFAFYKREIDTIQFTSSLKRIEAFAFSDCKNLKSLVFPDTLSWIGDLAFYKCSSVQEIWFSNNLEYIGEGAFDSCSVRALILPDSVQDIGVGCFEGCQQLETVQWSANLKLMRSQLFKDCTNLQAVDLPEGLEIIGEEAFHDCENLAQITLPSTLTTIGNEAFDGCEKLIDITLPESLQEIGNGAFGSSIDFPLLELSKTIKIGAYAFYHVHIAVFDGSENELGTCFIYRPDEFIFLGTPPENFPEYIEDEFYKVAPKVYYTEPYAEAWKPILVNGLNGWPTSCISLEEAQTRIAQAAVPAPEPTEDEGPWATDAILSMHISTPEPYTPPDQPTEVVKTDPLVYVFAGLLVLVAAGIVVIGVRTRKKHRANPHHTVKPE